MLFISPPFGNYLDFPYTKSIIGSYTLNERPGLFTQIYHTLYYSYGEKGWVNKIGLRNSGLPAILQTKSLQDKILSLAILYHDDIEKMEKMIPKNQDIELNISCPNVSGLEISRNFSFFLNPERKWCSVKLSPLVKPETIEQLYSQGFRQFHCSNTLPVKDGGLSGKSLIPYTYRTISQLKQYPDVEIIAGGGITSREIAELYLNHGAHHISVSSVIFNPWNFTSLYLQWLIPDFSIMKGFFKG